LGLEASGLIVYRAYLYVSKKIWVKYYRQLVFSGGPNANKTQKVGEETLQYIKGVTFAEIFSDHTEFQSDTDKNSGAIEMNSGRFYFTMTSTTSSSSAKR